MKKALAILLALCLIATFAGCRVKQKLSEKILENIIGNAGGGDVDIDGDTVTFQGEDGSSTTVGSTKWPESDFAKNIPEFKKGTISYVMQSEEYIYVTVDEVEAEDAESYAKTIREEFNVEPYETASSGAFTYMAKNEDGLSVSLMYSEDGTLLIMLGVS